MTDLLSLYALVVSALAAVGLIYLLYSGRFVVGYRRFFQLITFGLLLAVVVTPLVGRFEPALLHTVHGIATLFITVGLYDLLRDDIAQTEWVNVLFDDWHHDADSPVSPSFDLPEDD